ncbi:MAG: DUF5652 family protein, partial [Patescibacteria group bacterium]
FAGAYNADIGFPMFGLGVGLFTIGAILFFIIAIATVALKGYALWHAAKRDEKGWFVALLLINTLGILELVYLYFVVGKWKKSKTVISETTNEPKQ